MVSRILRRLRTLAGARRVDDEITRELHFHIQMEVDERVRSGMSEQEARRTALRDFGGVGRIREEVRDARGMTFWDNLWQDTRFGLRTLRRSPGYTLAAVVILALGIGANTAMFSVVYGVLVEPLPYRDDGELVLVEQSVPALDMDSLNVSIPELADYRGQLRTVRDLVEYHSMSFTLLSEGEPDRVDTGVVSANFFNMLGVRPLYGRTFVAADEELGAEAVLVLSHEYWQQKFGGDPSVVGRVLEMNNRPHTVIGVLPPHPQYPRYNDVYMPTSACPFRARAQETAAQNRRAFGALEVFGRLSPGETAERASTELATVAAAFDDRFPDVYETNGKRGEVVAHVQPLKEELVAGARPMLVTLVGTTLLVLLIACANVANLALARTVRRSRELAVRTALGAGRGRLVRQLVTESLIVALAGGALGLGLASVSVEMLTRFVGRFTPRTGQIDIDGGVLLFALVTSVATGVVAGLLPALSVRRSLSGAMHDGAAGSGEGRTRQRLRAGLVVAQVAVSFVLLVGAALLLESFFRLSSVPLGYRTEQVMTAAIYGNFTRMATAEDARRIQDGVLERLRASPGVVSAAVTNAVPQSALLPGPRPIEIHGMAPGIRPRNAVQNVASEGYFDTLGVPILAGRDFRGGDGPEASPVAIVNQSMAGLWEGRSPLGTTFSVAGANPAVEYTVVGVSADFRMYGADRDVEAQFYLPASQAGFGGGRLLVRTDRNPIDLAPVIKAAVHAVDETMPVEELRTLAEIRNERLAVPGLTAVLLSLFAGVALVVTLAGIAGLVGTSVSQRTREFGLRMALGATRRSVLNLVLRQGVVLVVIGAVIGAGGAYGFSRLLSRFLFETRPTDPAAYAAVAAVFVVAALAAAFGPARRATTIDPLTALRSE